MSGPILPSGELHLARIRKRLSDGIPLTVQHAVVAGGSPQALGMAVALIETGCRVTLLEENDFDVVRARDMLARTGKGAGIALTTDTDQARDADVLIEASGGDGLARVKLMGQLAALSPRALMVSLGAGVSLGSLKDQVEGPVALIECDAPPPAIGMIEILKGSDPAALGLAYRLGALPVIVPSFLGARLIAAMEDEAEALVFQGATPWEVDEAAEAFGFDLGPCAAQDLRGLDRALARHKLTGHDLPLIARMVPEGRLGRKGGVGWYRYPGGGGRVIDPLIEDLAREEAHFAGVAPREIGPDEITERLVGALLRSARAMKVEGDIIDLASVLACGFPEDRGGILHYAAELGSGSPYRI
ncbi:3-hydroxyacyl-CoA dehydrogenase family protein [Pararhodobacter sp. CCB-MM2]|uniref:3-hydroxyacyl-CoA dehydrogenase family protein n=1 Tax=Pararhodobacter sp. CCB-MM2 TaxID=1786003 RepID=UPI0008320D84|nr:3-hydroxyacyl-CoA dehydrogenase family protein [Pararhodobacter sp. CCB-MM2]MCA2013300.1 hypothetical protein [Cereibacter sphaeroides]